MKELNLELQINGVIEKTVAVEGDRFIIGRLIECDLQLPFSDISRHHTRLFKSASGDWLVEDMGSTNGTLLNDVPLTKPHAVHQGDVINLGHRINLIVVLYDRPDTELPEIGTMLFLAKQKNCTNSGSNRTHKWKTTTKKQYRD
jgi:adenylate cyclase